MLLLSIAYGLNACKPPSQMQLDIVRRQFLSGIPSASGIELTDQGIFVMGDDAEHLFQLNEKFEIVSQIRVARQLALAGSLRIPKAEKPDFEAMAALPDGRLLLFGSGSKSPQRDSVALVEPISGDVAHFSIAVLYEKTKAEAQLAEGALNIEAALVHDGLLYLFNRGENLIAACPLEPLLAHLQSGSACPEPQLRRVQLPSHAGGTAGFSGAAHLPGSGLALFTASVEQTDNWVDDGEVGGSLIGCLPLNGGKGLEPIAPFCLPIQAANGDWCIKVESIAVIGNPTPGAYRLLFVTDNDDGSSEIIEAVLNLDSDMVNDLQQ